MYRIIVLKTLKRHTSLLFNLFQAGWKYHPENINSYLYYFMSVLKAEFNFEKGRGFPSSVLMYDRQENSLFIPKIYNGDYTSKREVDMTSRPLDQEFVIGQSLQAHELVEAYGRGQLKGKLKEIAAKLDEESNLVIMLAKYKKRDIVICYGKV